MIPPWTLHLHRDVIRYLVSLRESGDAIRRAVRSLAYLGDGIPPGGVTQIQLGILLWETEGHAVVYEREPEKRRLLITQVERIRIEER